MPRVRTLAEDHRKTVIAYCLDWKGWDESRTEKELGIAKDARIARMKDIDRFSLGELTKIIHGVPLSPEQISILLGKVEWETSSLAMKLKGAI